MMLTLTRGVRRATPGFLATALADVTTPRAIRPCPPSFSLANRKMVSPAAMCLPPYMVFCAVNVKLAARGSSISALIANAMIPSSGELRGNGYATASRCRPRISSIATMAQA